MTPTHYIGTDLSQEIEFFDSLGDTIPAISIDQVKAFVLVNNVIKAQFTTEAPAPTGWEELTEATDIYTLLVPGADQELWTPGLIELEVMRKLVDEDATLVNRFVLAMAARSASQASAF
jgi:hypothetical protein